MSMNMSSQRRQHIDKVPHKSLHNREALVCLRDVCFALQVRHYVLGNGQWLHTAIVFTTWKATVLRAQAKVCLAYSIQIWVCWFAGIMQSPDYCSLALGHTCNSCLCAYWTFLSCVICNKGFCTADIIAVQHQMSTQKEVLRQHGSEAEDEAQAVCCLQIPSLRCQ